MNPIKFLYEDLKSDVVFIIDVIKGKYPQEYFTAKIHGIIKEVFTVEFWKRNWPIFLLMITFYLAGRLGSAWHYQDICNQYILDNFYNETQIFSNFTFNIK